MATYTVTYTIWDYESLELGDTNEKGFIEENTPIENDNDLDEDFPTQYELDSIISNMKNLENGNWSCYPIDTNNLVKGYAWYVGLYNEDIRTGDKECRAYHFDGLNEEQAKYILENIK